MAERELFGWSKVAAQNNFPPADGGWPEGQFRTTVNDAARVVLAAVRRWYDDPEWLDLQRAYPAGTLLTITKQSATVVRIAGQDQTVYFTVGRRVKMTGGTPSIVYAHVLSVVFAAGNTDVTLETFVGHTEVPAGLTNILVHHSSTLGKLAFQGLVDTGLFIPTAATSTALQAAIDAANAAGGGIVLLRHPSYACSASVILKAKVWLFGAGPRSTELKLNNAVDQHLLRISAADCGLLGCRLDGNQANQTSNTIDAISIEQGAARVGLLNVEIENARRDGIRSAFTANAVLDLTIDGFRILAPGRHGINIEDLLTTQERTIIANGVVTNPGANTTFTEVAGVKWAGIATISNVQVLDLNRGAPQTQRGFWGEQKLAAAAQHARNSTLAGFSVKGTGLQARGIELGGSGCSAGPGVVELTGATSRGLLIDATLPGEVADRNVVTGVAFRSCNVGAILQSDSLKNLISGCHFRGSTVNDVQLNGDDDVVQGCIFDGTTTAISVAASANNCRILGNSYPGVTTPISDAGTLTEDRPWQGRSYTEKTDGDQTSGVGTEQTITQMTALPYPAPGANGVRRFRLLAVVPIHVTGGGVSFRMRSGPLGTAADPIIAFVSCDGAVGDSNRVVVIEKELVPATGDTVTFTYEPGSSATWRGNSSAGRRATVLIEQVTA